MTKNDIFRAIKSNIKSIVSLAVGFITFGVANVAFTKKCPIDSTKNFASPGSKHTAMLVDAMTNGFWFPMIYGLLIAMTLYIILERPKYWFALIEINVALIIIFGLIQYKMIS
jgi:hypothetical protein